MGNSTLDRLVQLSNVADLFLDDDPDFVLANDYANLVKSYQFWNLYRLIDGQLEQLLDHPLLEVMAVNPVGYLVAPRFLALLVMLPCLTVFADLLGLVGGYLIGTRVYNISSVYYINTTLEWLLLSDILAGLLKSVVFAVIIGMVGCYRALVVEGGPEGVGRATMVSVVTTIVLIIVADSIFTAILT